MEAHVWFVASMCGLVIIALGAMMIDLRRNVLPKRAAELRASRPQRRMDKMA
jgi:hypothetical protein